MSIWKTVAALAALASAVGTAYAGSESVVYSFQGGLGGNPPGDGAFPETRLIEVGGALYGTTVDGGAYGEGTVFRVTLSGTETVLHSFAGAPDGRNPIGGLVKVGNELYGTTTAGGSVPDCGVDAGFGAYLGCGTVFRMTPAGGLTVVYSFKSGDDGLYPNGDLIFDGGFLYGTTQLGGIGGCMTSNNLSGCGTVFAVSRAGVETVLHAFTGGSDGIYPSAGVVDVGGTLYGTTTIGGAHSGGTMFQLSRQGAESVLYAFGSGSDGSGPGHGIQAFKGTLYGTTESGGSLGCYTGADACGTVFTVTPAGTETVLRSFNGPSFSNGGTGPSAPSSGLTQVDGLVYGTTAVGGTYGLDTVYSVALYGSHKVTVVYSFQGGSDGMDPTGTLVNVGGTLYGTTVSDGGTGCNGAGCGTVFKVMP